MVFRKIEDLLARGFSGNITLSCPGDGTVRKLKVEEYIGLGESGNAA